MIDDLDDDDDESKEINSGLAPRKFEGHGHWRHFRNSAVLNLDNQSYKWIT